MFNYFNMSIYKVVLISVGGESDADADADTFYFSNLYFSNLRKAYFFVFDFWHTTKTITMPSYSSIAQKIKDKGEWRLFDCDGNKSFITKHEVL